MITEDKNKNKCIYQIHFKETTYYNSNIWTPLPKLVL